VKTVRDVRYQGNKPLEVRVWDKTWKYFMVIFQSEPFSLNRV